MTNDHFAYYTPLYNSSTTANIIYGTTYNELINGKPQPFYRDPLLGMKLQEAAGIPETDLAWLKRRVGETCWNPA